MPPKTEPKGDYAVGYARPPTHTRFKPGQSGNPKGRRKDSIDPDALLRKAVGRKLKVLEDGKHRTISKMELMITTHVNKAAKGDARAFREVLAALVREAAAQAIPSSVVEVPLTADEQALLQEHIAGLRAAREPEETLP